METLEDEPMNFSAQTTSHLDCKLLKWTSTQDQIKEASNQAFIAYKPLSNFLTLEAYNDFIKSWNIHPITFKDNVVGAVFTKDNKIHVAVNGTWYPRKYIKEVMYPLFNTYNEIETTVDTNNPSGLKWVMKLGFKIVDQNSKQYKLILTKNDSWVL